MKRIAITGASGFIGSAAVRHYLDAGWTVLALGSRTGECLCERHRVETLTLPSDRLASSLASFCPDVLLHTAGSASVATSMLAPYDDYCRSVVATAHVLETLRTIAPECVFILCSSGAVYGEAGDELCDETRKIAPISPYGYHKAQCELLAQEYGQFFNLPVVVLRLFSVFGEGLRRQVVHDLFAKLSQNASVPVQLFGTGEEIRDFIHIDDVLDAIDCLVSHQALGIYNVGSGQPCSIAGLAGSITSITESTRQVVFSGECRAGDPLVMSGSMEKIHLLGFKCRVPLETGLERYAHWFARESLHA